MSSPDRADAFVVSTISPLEDWTFATVNWSPATTYIQPFGVLHITYDTYFRENALYPIDTGLEVGILPFDKLQMEVGFDFFMPINKSAGDPYDFPIVFNAKVGEIREFQVAPRAYFFFDDLLVIAVIELIENTATVGGACA